MSAADDAVTSEQPSTERDVVEVARAWIADDPDAETRAELQAIVDDALGGSDQAREALHERFDSRLSFGTAGLRGEIAAGPNFAHAMTKRMLHQEWTMGVDEAIEAEAQAQAICMMTQDFHRAYHAFVAKQRPEFKGD